ncbi:MAG TPA: SxtJ family membrane protein [Vicinamibacteria bacterium]|nr:SxtJ family membrane protein [Vicinamibacteria bacterium]
MTLQDAVGRFAALPLRWKVLAFATAVVLVELAFRRFAPKSRAYTRWTAFFQGIGRVWTAILLAIVYLSSVGPVGLVMRLFGHDPLDRRLAPEPSFWRAHEPNPLGPERAARHQF